MGQTAVGTAFLRLLEVRTRHNAAVAESVAKRGCVLLFWVCSIRGWGGFGGSHLGRLKTRALVAGVLGTLCATLQNLDKLTGALSENRRK